MRRRGEGGREHWGGLPVSSGCCPSWSMTKSPGGFFQASEEHLVINVCAHSRKCLKESGDKT